MQRLAVIGFFLISTFLLNFGHPISSDEGVVLDAAWNLYNGRDLYKDFATFIAPASFLTTSWLFKILGPNYWTAKFFSILLLALSVFAIYQITQGLTRNRLASLTAAWVWLLTASIAYSVINYNSHSTFLTTVAIYIITRGIKDKQPFLFFLSGILIGLVTATLQHKGIILTVFLFLILASFMTLKKLKVVDLLSFSFGAVQIPLLAVVIFGPKILLDNLFIWPMNYSHIHNTLPYTIVFLILISFIATFIYLKTRAKKINKEALMILFATQIALYLSIYNRLDVWHMAINSFSFLIFATVTIYHLFPPASLAKRLTPYKYPIMAYLFIIPLVIFLSSNLPTFTAYKLFKEKITSYNVSQIYAHPYLPGLYFELKAANPYPYDVLFTNMHPQSAFLENLKVLVSQKPKHILLSYALVEKFNYDATSPLDIYIKNNYQQIDSLGNLIIMARKEDPVQ